MGKNVEIERKWAMKDWPPMKTDDVYDVYQAYLSIEPEVRIRRKVGRGDDIKHTLTIKGNGDMVRAEVEMKITAEQYDALLQMIPQKPIHKRYRKYYLTPTLALEVSHVDPGTDQAFMYAEIEFPDEESAKSFVAPAYYGEELTGDAGFKMKNYWKVNRLNKAPTIISCTITVDEADKSMCRVNVWYDCDSKHRECLFSYHPGDLPNLSPTDFIGLTRGEALLLPWKDEK